MANIRNLKKDIAGIVSDVISDCQLFILFNPKHNTEAAYSVVEDAIEMYNRMLHRVNHPNGKDNPKLVKQHYKALHEDLLKESNILFERISKLRD
jgi:hypothetical protein